MEEIDNKLLAIGIMLGFLLGSLVIGLAWMFVDGNYYKVTPAQTQAQVISFPNGAVFKQIKTVEDLKGE